MIFREHRNAIRHERQVVMSYYRAEIRLIGRVIASRYLTAQRSTSISEKTVYSRSRVSMTVYSLSLSIRLYLSAVAPHLQPFTFEEANSGDLIIVHCAVVKGDTPISLKWWFEGRHLEVGDGVGITALGDRVSALTIPAVRGEHAGEYACVADNPAGRARHSAHLKVNGTEKTTHDHSISA